MKPKVFVILACFQLVVIALLGIKIYRQTKILGTKIAVTSVDKESVTINPSSELQNFYEPKPYSTEEDHAPWLEDKIEYYINSDSLREDREYEISKPDSTFRIVTLGDSFTFGASVSLQDNYPKQLETLLNNNYKCPNIQKFEVINLGVRGYDVQYAVERFILRGKTYNPDIILWLLKDDDFFQIEEIVGPLVAKFLRELYLNNESGYVVSENETITYPWYEKALKIMQDMYNKEEILDYQMSAMNKINNHYNKTLIILTFPSTRSEYKQEINRFAESRANTYFYKYLVDPNQTADVQPDGHPTAKGYSLMAKSVLDYLKSKPLIPCN